MILVFNSFAAGLNRPVNEYNTAKLFGFAADKSGYFINFS
jgi:hypothetical protein